MSNIEFSPIAVLGAGAWGTALSLHLANSHQEVHLWEFDRDQVKLLQKDHTNERYLSGFFFPENLTVYENLADAIKTVKTILVAVPSFAFKQTLLTLKPLINSDVSIVWATKGIDPESCELLHTIAKASLGARSFAVLSGPSFAKEVAKGLPTAVSLASNNTAFADELVKRFNQHAFRVYTSDDLVGVQLGGAVKNVIAIAIGLCDGLAYGANARCALITRGIAEIMRLGLAMGAKQETFMGLSGMGDLVLTCTDNQSRNRRFGLALGQGIEIDVAKKQIGQVIEGTHTVKQVIALANQYHVEMPICDMVNRILNNEISPKSAVLAFLSREPKSEF